MECFSEDEVNNAAGVVIPADAFHSILTALSDLTAELKAMREKQEQLTAKVEKIEKLVESLVKKPDSTPVSPSTSTILEPYVTVEDKLNPGRKHELYLSDSEKSKLLGTKSVQQAVRIFLLAMYDVNTLRGFTLTGNTTKPSVREHDEGEGGGQAGSPAVIQLPPVKVDLVEAAVLKLFKVPEERQESEMLKLEWIEDKKKKSRSSITNILQDMKKNFSENGNRIAKSSKGKKARVDLTNDKDPLSS